MKFHFLGIPLFYGSFIVNVSIATVRPLRTLVLSETSFEVSPSDKMNPSERERERERHEHPKKGKEMGVAAKRRGNKELTGNPE